MTLDYRGTQIYYTTTGTGNPMVFLHGFLESSNIWKPFIPGLSTKHQVICIDLPGHGKTGTLGEVHSMELMADAVKAVLDKLKVANLTLVGHSMGGYVSLAFLELSPEMVKRIILLNSTPEADSEEKKANRDRAVELVQKNKRTYVSMAISNLLTPKNNRNFKSEIENLKKEAASFSKEGIIASLKGMKIRTDRFSLLKKFNNEKYIIIGKDDPVLDWKRVNQVALESDCEVILTENGHLSFIEDFVIVREFLLFID